MSYTETRNNPDENKFPERVFETKDDAFVINHNLEKCVMESNFNLCAHRKPSNK